VSRNRIDVHSHYLGGAAARLLAGAPPMPGGYRLGPWTTQRALEFMDRHDIATQLLSFPLDVSARLDERQAAQFARTLNEELAGVVKEHPDRFGAFATLPLLAADAAVAELAHALDDLGLDGVVLPSNAGGRYFGQSWFEPILAELSRRRVPTFVHPAECPGIEVLGFGRPPSVIEFPLDTARNIANAIYRGVFLRHPGLTLILAHAGGALPALGWRIAEHHFVGQGPADDPAVDKAHIAEVLRALYYETAIASGPHSLLPALACTGPDHILFGTDWPAAPESAVVDMIDQFAAFDVFGEAERAGVERENARRLFPRLA
jgi:6-methylsalicylate decarboxylase